MRVGPAPVRERAIEIGRMRGDRIAKGDGWSLDILGADTSPLSETLSKNFVENFVGTTIRPSKAAQHRRDSSQESPSERQIHASRQTLLLAKVKIGSALDCRCGCHIKKSTMVQFRVPAIAFRNIQQEARGGFVELPISPITQFRARS